MPFLKFDDSEIAQLRRMLQAFNGGELNTDRNWHQKQKRSALDTYIGRADVDIEGRDSDTPGSGDVSLYTISSSTSATLTDTGANVIGYNIQDSVIDADAYVTLNRDPFSGKYIITPINTSSTDAQLIEIICPNTLAFSSTSCEITYETRTYRVQASSTEAECGMGSS